MKYATEKGKKQHPTEHKGTVPRTRTTERRPVAKGQDNSSSSPSGRSTPARDKKTGKFLPSKRKVKSKQKK